MATIVGTLIFEMAANVARLQSDMAKANSTVNGAMQGIKGAVDTAKSAFAALGIAASLAGFEEMIRRSIDSMNALHELSAKTGQTVEDLSRLRDAARTGGADLDTMGRSLVKLSQGMKDAADNGTGKAARAFDELGIKVVDSDGHLRNSVEVMVEVARKLSEMDDQTRAVVLRQDIFGKSGVAVAGALHELAEKGAGAVTMTTNQADAAHEAHAAFQQWGERSATLQREFTTGMLPALNSLASALTSTGTATNAAREAGQVFGQAMTYVGQILYGAWSAADLFGKTLGLISGAMGELATGHPMNALRVMKEGMQDISDTAAKAGERIAKMGEAAGNLPKPARGKRTTPVAGGGGEGEPDDDNYAGEFAGGGTIGAGMWGIVGEAGPEIVSGGAGGATVTPLRGGFGGIVASANSINKALRDTKVLGEDLGNVLDRAGIRGVKSMGDLQNVLRNVAVELIKAGRSPLIKYLTSGGGNGVVPDDFVGDLPTDDAAGGSIGDFFAGMFAGGGTIPPGMWGIAGEAGPEVISGGTSGASVSPMRGGGMNMSFGDININAPGADSAKLSQLIAEVRNLRANVGTMAVIAVQRVFNQRGYVTPVG